MRPIRLRGLASRIIYRARWELSYAFLRNPKTREPVDLDENRVVDALEAAAIPSNRFQIDVSDYNAWMQRADYATYDPGYYPDNLPEKSLEHYLAAHYLELQPGQTYIDVASQNGTAAEIYTRLYGVSAYQQDLDFPKGLRGKTIGGDAANMPVPDNFADAMALHCSFEHFEGDSDTRFIRELQRVLKPGGTCVILPLYLCHRHTCLTNPSHSVMNRVPFDPEAIVHASLSWHNRHGRFYSVDQFIERVWKHRGSLNIEINIIQNYREVDPSCYLRFAAVIRKPAT